MSGQSPSPDFPARLSAEQARHLAEGTWPLEAVRSSRIELEGKPQAVREARQAVAAHLGALLDAEQLERLRLLTTELVTNALTHGEGRSGIVMYLAAAPERVRVEVCDGGEGFAVPSTAPTPGDTGGRGLRLVDTVASRWGVAGDAGTCVWFELDRE